MKPSPAYSAKTADKHHLYELSVQNPEADVRFIDRVFKKRRQRRPFVLREDFCGTAKLCADWVNRRPSHQAIGVDLDDATLAWAYRNNIATLGDTATQIRLLNLDVMQEVDEQADVTVAFNFSYCIFKSRPQLLEYFKTARRGLKEDGAFFLDMHGGRECFEPLEEETEHEGFSYVWDQEPYDAINGYARRFIHFRFPDGTEQKRAFSYDWRLWTLPEVKDALLEAGFSAVDVFWEGVDKEGEGNGVFRRVTRAEDEESWIAYVAAWV